MRGVEPAHQPDDGDFVCWSIQTIQCMADKLFTQPKCRITNNVLGTQMRAGEKIHTAIEALIAAINQIRGNDIMISSIPRSFSNATGAAAAIPNAASKLFDGK